MPNLITLNRNNYIGGNSYKINIPGQYKAASGDKIALQSIAMFNSSYNISTIYGNNQLTLYMPSGATTLSSVLTIPNGYYSVSDLNYLIQQALIKLGWFLIGTDSNLFYHEIVENSTQYGIQINLYPVTSTLPSGYSLPTSGTNIFSLPTVTKTSGILFNDAFGDLIGFTGQSIAVNIATVVNQKLSSKLPTMSITNTYIFTCSLISNAFSNPPDVFFMQPIDVEFGQLINNTVIPVYQNIQPGLYNDIVIRVYNQNFDPVLFDNLTSRDYELTIMLSLKLKEED